jgi:hypothetical protein
VVRGWNGRASTSVTLVPSPHKTTKQTGSSLPRESDSDLSPVTPSPQATTHYAARFRTQSHDTHHCQCPHKGPIQVMVPNPAVRWRLGDCSSSLASSSVFSHTRHQGRGVCALILSGVYPGSFLRSRRQEQPQPGGPGGP